VTAELCRLIESGSLATVVQPDRSAQILAVFDAGISAGAGEVFGERPYRLQLQRRGPVAAPAHSGDGSERNGGAGIGHCLGRSVCGGYNEPDAHVFVRGKQILNAVNIHFRTPGCLLFF